LLKAHGSQADARAAIQLLEKSGVLLIFVAGQPGLGCRGITTITEMRAIYHLSIKELKREFIHDLEEQFGDAPVELAIGSVATGYTLTEEQFWSLISLLDWEKLPDEAAVAEPLIQALADAPVRYIYDFYDLMSEKLYALDGAVYAANIGRGSWQEGQPFSGDHFLDVRSCAVANGKEFYQEALRNPKQMPQDTYFEILPYVPSIAYERKTGRPFIYAPKHNYLTFSNKQGWTDGI
jgi:hypothetical protein